ncbi:DUF2232 domain-containing protein [Hoeflea ulvae]|uniref:DUF2232 domain-containing protein n=1 Tax=Hoeflea ulvae TaxID=2983764 RepID=A0ABT3YEZ9_9HYPH|nr:DUF2232 domain-containing protein [Hoeflea ulvae]MCY0094478.1 DUF2232 domain-containing protein [Hoeflea ulvae]
MTQQSTSLLVGLLAGVSAAFLLVSAGSPSGLSFFLFAAAALPVLIAGLGWSNLASIVAVVCAMAIIALTTTPQAALVSAVTTLAPAAWIAHLSNLARPAEEIGGPEGGVIWYPLSDIFMNIAACVCVGLVAVGLATGYGPEFIGELVDVFVTTIKDSNADYQPSAEGLAEMKQFFLFALPAIQAAMWVLILFAGWYVASAIVRLSGRSKRPKDDIPSQLRVPRLGALALAAGAVMSFSGGGIGLIGWTLVGAFGICFVVAGFAIAHHRTRGKPARGLLLSAAYLATVIFTIPLGFFLFLGLFDTARTLTATNSGPRSRP